MMTRTYVATIIVRDPTSLPTVNPDIFAVQLAEYLVHGGDPTGLNDDVVAVAVAVDGSQSFLWRAAAGCGRMIVDAMAAVVGDI